MLQTILNHASSNFKSNKLPYIFTFVNYRCKIVSGKKYLLAECILTAGTGVFFLHLLEHFPKQAGTGLCQAQGKIKLANFWLILFDLFGFV